MSSYKNPANVTRMYCSPMADYYNIFFCINTMDLYSIAHSTAIDKVPSRYKRIFYQVL